MYIKGIINSIRVLICYFLLIVSLSSLILGYRVRAENIFKRFMIYLVFGNFYISSIVFVLGYLNIFNRFSLILSLFFTSLFLGIILNRKEIKEKTLNIRGVFNKLVMGVYGTKLFLWRTGRMIINRVKRFSQELFTNKKIEWTILIPIIAYNVYQYGINNIEYLTYMSPDEEVHLYWVQSLIGGNIFPSGVYPHMFHNVVAAISELFGLGAVITLKYFGTTSCVLIMTMLYFGLRKVFTTKYPALFGLMIYSIINIYGEQVTYRFQFAIPQEYAMIMLMPMGIFLFDYIKDKKRLDLIFFGMSLSLMLGIHFYTGIIGAILVLCIGIVYIYKIIKDKIFLKLLICGILSIVIAIAPLGLGLILGYEMEQSMDWASEVVKGDIYEEKEPEVLTWEKFVKDANKDLTKHVVTDINVIYIFIGIILFALIFNLICIALKKANDKNAYQIIFILNSSILMFVMLLRSLQLPTIMETKRVAIFFAYFSPVLIGMPLEIINRLLNSTRLKKAISVISMGAIPLGLFLILEFNYVRPIPPFYYFQTTGTMIANMGIIENYEDHTWTAVSPVNNISAVLNHGYHYELDDFIIAQENWNKEKELKIPTEYVFVYIEKRPIIKYGFRFYKDELNIMDRKIVSKEDALKKLTNKEEDNYHYKKERHILMAKAYYWAKEYQKYFPKETDVYYEDPELIVYRIKQNPYALNNFSIDYGMNKR